MIEKVKKIKWRKHRAWERYNTLSLLTGKERQTIMVFFSRNKLDIMSNEAYLNYVKKFYIYNR